MDLIPVAGVKSSIAHLKPQTFDLARRPPLNAQY